MRRIQQGITAYNALNADERDAVNIRDMIDLEESSGESDLEAAEVLLPPNARCPPGRPKKQRMRSGGEHLGARIQHCSRCGEEGHTKRTCARPLNEQIA